MISDAMHSYFFIFIFYQFSLFIKGLVVPVIRNADQLSCAGIEKAIGEYGAKVGARHITCGVCYHEDGKSTYFNLQDDL